MSESSVSKYEQVKATLREEIISGKLAKGEKIPTEPELVSLYGVGRNSIREAVSSLVHEGLLIKHQGRGTFVIGAQRQSPAFSKTEKVVGLCYPQLPYNRDLLRYCQEYLMDKGGLLVQYDIVRDDQSPEKEKNFLLKAEKNCFQGVILLPSPFAPTNQKLFQRLRENGVKVALLEPYQQEMNEEVFFLPDYYKAGYMTSAKMAVAGVKHLVMARGRLPISYQWLKAGMIEAAKDLGLELLDDIVFNPWNKILKNAKDNYPEISEIMRKLPENTGMISTQWEAAKATKEILQHEKRRIQEEIKLCSWYSHIPEEDPGVSRLQNPNRQILTDAIDYILDDNIPSTKIIQKRYNLSYEETGTVLAPHSK